jgi:hypothetical protein
MSLIKPRTRGKQMVQHRTRLDHENNETLFAYAAFIGEDPQYVLNELIDTVLAKDKEFAAWRRDHSGPFAARPAAPRKRERARRGGIRRDNPTPTSVAAADQMRT